MGRERERGIDAQRGPQWCLLDERLISVSAARGVESATLPEVLSRLAGGDDISFAALQPHQRHAWHAFLVQLGGLVAQRRAGREMPVRSDDWAAALLDLADGQRCAWTMIVPDATQCALLQPAIPDADLGALKKVLRCPDEADILVLARAHDVKSGRIRCATAEHWLFTLIDLQTMGGFSGAGNYGIARMNGGFASRPAIGYAPDRTWARRFQRDVAVLLASRGTTSAAHGYPASGGKALLWTEPWDGKTALSLATLDPFFLEVSRRVRLTWEEGTLALRAGTSTCARVDPGESHGSTGDPWTPVWVEDGSALTISGTGFTYDLIRQFLFPGEQAPGAALRLFPSDGPEPWLLGQVLVRGQGKTEGLHEFALPVPPAVKARLLDPVERSRMAVLAKRQVATASDARLKVLKPALLSLLQVAPPMLNWKDDRGTPWLGRFDREVEGAFFDHLWTCAGLDEESARASWGARLEALARGVLEDAIRVAPLPEAHRLRAVAGAERVFDASGRKHLTQPPLASATETK